MTTGPVVFMCVGDVQPVCLLPVKVIALDDSVADVAPMFVVPVLPVTTPLFPPLIKIPPLFEITETP